MDEREIDKFRVGYYQHYKGGIYKAVGLVTHHETRQPMVIYVPESGELTVRPLQSHAEDPDAWNDWVQHKGERVRRFAYLGNLSFKPKAAAPLVEEDAVPSGWSSESSE